MNWLHMGNQPSIRFRLWELLTLPVVVGVLITVNRTASLRESIPLVFALWVAIHQRRITRLPIVNPFTVGAVAGMICFTVYDLNTFTAEQEISIAGISRTAFTGAMAGLGFGVASCLYTAIGQLTIEPFLRRLCRNEAEHGDRPLDAREDSDECENSLQ